MRIAQIAPLAESVPPKLYGGTERVVAWLVDELVELGHDVTLFASGDSVTRAKLNSVWPRALRLGRPRSDPIAAQAVLLEAMALHAAEFDVIHVHVDWLHLPFAEPARRPVPHHHAWAVGFARYAGCYQPLSCCALRFHFGQSTRPAWRGKLAWHRLSRPARRSAPSQLRRWVLSCLSRPPHRREGT